MATPSARRSTLAQAAPPASRSTGTIILGGGATIAAAFAEFAKRLIALAGGPDATIVIIPTANESFPPALRSLRAPTTPEQVRGWLAAQGAHRVVLLHTRDRKIANFPGFASVLKTTKAVWIPGGRSTVVEQTYRGTLVERELE
ncbi:MAG: hypothetical protein M3081_11265 [Gemmatimonadota bacterium]|nr:hypothetical protein [Gemmatimonadota bacterium]